VDATARHFGRPTEGFTRLKTPAFRWQKSSARLRASGQLAELRAADLRFTSEEVAAFLRTVWRLNLSTEAVAALENKTEGWAAGLQLAALSLRDRSDPDAFLRAFTGTNRYVLDYLSEEVLQRQSDRVRTFLLQTSILERLSGPLCDAVTGRSTTPRPPGTPTGRCG
jgi:LuxR family maltose regulon positive regulatory protein